jgi:zinc protease
MMAPALPGSIVRRAVIALLALPLFAAPALATTIERVVSPGGIEAWLVHEPAVPMIAIDFAFVGGAAQDAPGKGGTASLVASLLGFQAERDTLRGTLRTLTENKDEAFEYLRLAVTQPRFDQSDVEVIRAQILSMLRRATTSPTDIANLRWWQVAFADHPYGRPVNGTLESVPTVTIADLKDYTHRVLGRGNLKVAVVGDIDAKTVKVMLDRVFGGLPAQPELKPVPNVSPQGLGRRIVVKVDVPQAVLAFGGPGIARKDPDFMAAYIVNHILGGGAFSSRLYQEVREKRGLAYSVYDSLVWLNHSALFLGGTATRADRAGETLDVIDKEIHRLADEGPTADELAKAKAYLKGSFVLNLDTSSKIAALLVQLQLDGLGIDYFTRRPEMINGVTLEDARRVAKRMLDTGMLVTVAGRPEGIASTSTP